jgi:hypothetical protein
MNRIKKFLFIMTGLLLLSAGPVSAQNPIRKPSRAYTPGKPIHPGRNAISPAMSTGVKPTCIPAFRLMQVYSAASSIMMMLTGLHAAKK